MKSLRLRQVKLPKIKQAKLPKIKQPKLPKLPRISGRKRGY